MQVILTPTAVADKFGPGLHGFKGSIPPLPPPTQLSPEWFDSVQMELVNLVLSQGLALDGLQFDQVVQAISSWTFTGTPKIASGGSLTINSGATFTTKSGSTFLVQSAMPTFGPFTEVNIQGDVLVGTDAANMMTVNATSVFQELATFNGTFQALANSQIGTTSADTMTVYANVTLPGGADITGTNATTASVGNVEFLLGGPPPSNNGLFVSGLGELFQGLNNRVHISENGYVYATGDQEVSTGLSASLLVATTTQAVRGRGNGNVRVRVEGLIQVSVLPQTITIDVQENQTANPAYTDIGTEQLMKAEKTTADVTDWQPFVHERVFAAGTTTYTSYRASIDPGGSTGRVKEVRLRVMAERF